jgi:hypothetical protein
MQMGLQAYLREFLFGLRFETLRIELSFPWFTDLDKTRVLAGKGFDMSPEAWPQHAANSRPREETFIFFLFRPQMIRGLSIGTHSRIRKSQS